MPTLTLLVLIAAAAPPGSTAAKLGWVKPLLADKEVFGVEVPTPPGCDRPDVAFIRCPGGKTASWEPLEGDLDARLKRQLESAPKEFTLKVTARSCKVAGRKATCSVIRITRDEKYVGAIVLAPTGNKDAKYSLECRVLDEEVPEKGDFPGPCAPILHFGK